MFATHFSQCIPLMASSSFVVRKGFDPSSSMPATLKFVVVERAEKILYPANLGVENDTRLLPRKIDLHLGHAGRLTVAPLDVADALPAMHVVNRQYHRVHTLIAFQSAPPRATRRLRTLRDARSSHRAPRSQDASFSRITSCARSRSAPARMSSSATRGNAHSPSHELPR